MVSELFSQWMFDISESSREVYIGSSESSSESTSEVALITLSQSIIDNNIKKLIGVLDTGVKLREVFDCPQCSFEESVMTQSQA